ncbi:MULTISPECIES: Rrf2 family transcriptional regulator [unclassified Ensifer]|uniref:RrF2 family transcriptional regulator n=1 Tax=unclassified Ensifer TaxID=2633371 RepID=UPI0008131F2A|nr:MULTISPECIES: Rrf2 family transcriptional regulator [unclassified Ensifer]OCP05803.1 Rrf2 family transcriptional regulator [Ensifer sp. LC11]OCP06547.1 Rrf2 family transcriptional regulator [Ensifer sp. LC13]OCP06727.1 Rrf2 family transcriptional regulator [Ensifer sp. LC14]OCP31213.1 Rrf2 family transcriptional regulator [Ensifer sp. LC499]
MILKSQVEWALHCCAILAGLPEGRYLSTKALAEFHGLPKEYLSKALQGLSQAGLVDTTLGPSGGYRLAKDPAELTFLDIVEAVEGTARTFVCTNIRANNPCRPAGYCESSPCAVARIMWEADEAWRQKLRSVRLADLIEALSKEIPAELWKSSFEWVLGRAG